MRAMMTVDDVKRRVDAIQKAGNGDPEGSHWEQDRLYVEVLTAIASGATDNPAGLAAEALRIEHMDLTRWYA